MENGEDMVRYPNVRVLRFLGWTKLDYVILILRKFANIN